MGGLFKATEACTTEIQPRACPVALENHPRFSFFVGRNGWIENTIFSNTTGQETRLL